MTGRPHVRDLLRLHLDAMHDTFARHVGGGSEHGDGLLRQRDGRELDERRDLNVLDGRIDGMVGRVFVLMSNSSHVGMHVYSWLQIMSSSRPVRPTFARVYSVLLLLFCRKHCTQLRGSDISSDSQAAPALFPGKVLRMSIGVLVHPYFDV